MLYETFVTGNLLIWLSFSCLKRAQNMLLFGLVKFGDYVLGSLASVRLGKSAQFLPRKENFELLLMTSRPFPIISSNQNKLHRTIFISRPSAAL